MAVTCQYCSKLTKDEGGEKREEKKGNSGLVKWKSSHVRLPSVSQSVYNNIFPVTIHAQPMNIATANSLL